MPLIPQDRLPRLVLLRAASRYPPKLRASFEAGADCELNGASVRNCHFWFFGSPEQTRAWEHGKRLQAEISSRTQAEVVALLREVAQS